MQQRINKGDSVTAVAGCNAPEWSVSHYSPSEKYAPCNPVFSQNLPPLVRNLWYATVRMNWDFSVTSNMFCLCFNHVYFKRFLPAVYKYVAARRLGVKAKITHTKSLFLGFSGQGQAWKIAFTSRRVNSTSLLYLMCGLRQRLIFRTCLVIRNPCLKFWQCFVFAGVWAYVKSMHQCW